VVLLGEIARSNTTPRRARAASVGITALPPPNGVWS
jgi:hypothetical protein